MTDVVLRNRDIDTSGVSPDRFGAPLVLGSIAFESWASAANPTDEVLDQATAQLVTEQAVGVTISLANGTIAVPRDGVYEIELVLSKVSSASASGVMNFTIQKNAAALTPSITLGLLQPAVVSNHMSAHAKGFATLVKGDLIRATVTGTVGGVITVASGRLVVRQVSDSTVFTQV
jgi:hypothetical protein